MPDQVPPHSQAVVRGYFIGGSPCSGKSSVANLLAARSSLMAFHCDDNYDERLTRLKTAGGRWVNELGSISKCERLAHAPDWQAEREVGFYHDQFPHLIDDLPQKPFIAEGADLLPELLASINVPLACSAWVIPTPEFQLDHYSRRDWAHDYVNDCPDPKQAYDNWMRRDMLFAEHVAREARKLGGLLIIVDGRRTIESISEEIELHFGIIKR